MTRPCRPPGRVRPLGDAPTHSGDLSRRAAARLPGRGRAGAGFRAHRKGDLTGAADEYWTGLKADPRFLAVTQGILVPAGPAEVSAALERAFTTGRTEGLAPFLSDEGTVEVVTVCSVCDPPAERATKKLARSALVRHIAGA